MSINGIRCLVSKSRAIGLVSFVLSSVCCSSNIPNRPSDAIIPAYAGDWSGRYGVMNCDQSGGMAGFDLCRTNALPQTYSLRVSQAARNVTATFTLDFLQFPTTSGIINPDGSLTLSATDASTGFTIVATWHLNVTNDGLTGTVAQNWTSDSFSGSVSIIASVMSAVRSV